MFQQAKVIVKDTFVMPPVDETCELVLQQCADLMVGCWIWNPSCGYLEVTKYGGYDIYVTVRNTGMEENARVGTVFPSCMEFIISAPRYTPIVDNTLTCLAADFKSPAVDETALMVVDSTSAIRNGDTIVVARDYQYIVEEIINETTMRVLNVGKGAEEDIKVGCGECVPVKIFESSHCCEVLQEEVDDIYDTLNNRHSIKAWTGNNLVTISGGNDALVASYDVTVKVDNDLSKYDNSISKFTKLLYFKEELVTSGSRKYAYLVPNTDSEATHFMIGKDTGTLISEINASQIYAIDVLCSYKDARIMRNTYTDRVGGGAGYGSSTSEANYIYFGALGADTEYRNGTSSSYNAHSFYSGNKKVFSIGHDDVTSYVNILPENNNHNLTLGNASRTWSNVYTDAITLNGTTYTSIPTPITPNDGHLYIYNTSDQVNPAIDFTANQSSDTTAVLADVAFSGSYSDLSGTPSIPSSLVYFEEVLNGTTASWEPKSGAEKYDLGTSGKRFNYAYINRIQREDAYIYLLYNSHIQYNTVSGSKHEFKINETTKFTIEESKSIFSVPPIPINNTITLGGSSNYWNVAYINKINVTSTSSIFINSVNHLELQNTVNTDGVGIRFTVGNGGYSQFEQRTTLTNPYGGTDTVYYAFIPQTVNYGSLGKSGAYWATAYLKTVYANNLYPVTSTFSATSTAGDIGSSAHKWNQVYATNLNGAVSPSSDIKKKENIVERGTEKSSSKSLDKILTLKTYNYVLKEDITKQERIGIMAQELREVEPVLVVNKAEEGSKDEDLYYDLTGFVTLLMEAVKELAQDVADLKKSLTKEPDGK